MRFKWFTVLAATTALVGVGAQAASAKVPPQQMSRFKAVEAAFSAPDSKWTTALEALGTKATVPQVSKAMPRLHPGPQGLRQPAC